MIDTNDSTGTGAIGDQRGKGGEEIRRPAGKPPQLLEKVDFVEENRFGFRCLGLGFWINLPWILLPAP
jgi:hypothetical protein